MSTIAMIHAGRAVAPVVVCLMTLALADTAAAAPPEPCPEDPQESAAGEPADSREDPDESEAEDDEAAAGDGSGKALTVFGSYGTAVEINGSAPIDVRTFGVRWSRRWGPKGGGLLRGNPTLSIEIIPAMLFDQEPSAWAPVFHVIYEHRLAPQAAVRPVLRAGAGFGYADHEVPPNETHHNFSLLVGLGLDIDIASNRQLAVEYRFHHISNANSGTINPGINAHTLVVGFTFELR